MNPISVYGEYGAIGLVCILFSLMILNLIKSQKSQTEDLDEIRQANAKLETKMSNVESIILKMLDRWNKSDDISQRHREDIVKELNDVTDDLAYLKGRINGKSGYFKYTYQSTPKTLVFAEYEGFLFISSICMPSE